MRVGIDQQCGVITAAYRSARVSAHDAGRGATHRLLAGFPADASHVPSGHVGNSGVSYLHLSTRELEYEYKKNRGDKLQEFQRHKN